MEETVDVIVAVCAVLGALLGGGGVMGIAVTWGRVRQKIETIEERNRRLTQMYDDFQKMHGECLQAQRARFEQILKELGDMKTGMAVAAEKFEDFLQWAHKNGKTKSNNEEE